MIIELNNTNCIELTSDELEAKMNELNDSINLDWLIDEIEEEEIVETIEITSEQKKWLTEIEKYEKLLKDWSNRTYKKSKGTVYVGTELNGDKYSYNYINEKRKANNIKIFADYINEYKQYLKESGYKLN